MYSMREHMKLSCKCARTEFDLNYRLDGVKILGSDLNVFRTEA